MVVFGAVTRADLGPVILQGITRAGACRGPTDPLLPSP